MQRIVIVGSPGGGKSTLARALGAKLGLPVHHLDALFWRPGWVEAARTEFDQAQADAVRGERWIIDGNYGRTYALRMARADTIVWVDLARGQCLWRTLRRWGQWRGRVRPDMGERCPERLPDLGFLRFIWNFRRETEPKLRAAIAEHGGHAALVRVRSDVEMAAFVDGAR